jgi:lactate permease
VLSGGRIRFSILTSSGAGLAAAALLLCALQPVRLDHKVLWKRTRTAIIGLGCFMLLAQLIHVSGMVAAIAGALQAWDSHADLLLMTAPLVGMLSGFLTGSNVGGNALMMPIQTHVGQVARYGLLFSALQHSAAGRAVFTSVPIIILVMTIARDGVAMMDASHVVLERDLLQFGLQVALCLYIALLLAFVVLHWEPSLGSVLG